MSKHWTQERDICNSKNAHIVSTLILKSWLVLGEFDEANEQVAYVVESKQKWHRQLVVASSYNYEWWGVRLAGAARTTPYNNIPYRHKIYSSHVCDISYTDMAWKRIEQGRAVQQNSSAGIIMSNQSLVLQRIDRQTAGIYTCLATNVEGQGESNALALPVKCKSKRS